MSELFVTSYNSELYQASACGLLKSFVKHMPGRRLLSCWEGTPGDVQHPALTYAGIDDEPLLTGWLAAHRDIIPAYLGGAAEPCGCPDAHIRHSKQHVRGCRWTYMNRNACRWYRKVVAMNVAIRDPDLTTMIWFDADVRVRKEIPHKYIKQQLANVAVFYFRGHRAAIESGVLGFNLQNGAREFLATVLDRYQSGRFREDERWDDGAQFTYLMATGQFRGRDLVHPTRWYKKTNHVIPTTTMAQYLEHDKGKHSRELNIVF